VFGSYYLVTCGGLGNVEEEIGVIIPDRGTINNFAFERPEE
jgi:hypothetical protein